MSQIIRNKIYQHFLDCFKDLKLNKNAQILDIWCWNWWFLKSIYNLWYYNLFWIEWYDIKHKINYANIQKHVFTDKLYFDNNMFDIVFILDLVEHIPNQYVLFNEIHRILKEKWYVVISTPNIYSFLWKISFLFKERLYWFKDNNVNLKEWYAHINPFIPNIFQIYYNNKFQLIKSHHFWFIIPLINKFVSVDNKLLSWNSTFIIQKV